VLRDNIQDITKPAIRRLARRGGVNRISRLIYEETRGVLEEGDISTESGVQTEIALRRVRSLVGTPITGSNVVVNFHTLLRDGVF
jgi:hypothetical protein